MYTKNHIFPVLHIKYLIKENGTTTKPFKLAAGTKPSVSQICVLFCACVVCKANVNIDIKVLNMRHQSQKGFVVSFLEFHNIKKGYLMYIPSTRKIIFSYDVVFDESVSIILAYTS